MPLTPRLEILSFTDPFCSWCWAMEPLLLRLKETYRDQVRVRPVMGGLVEDMANFLDAANGISSTADVAPHWDEVSAITGQPIDGSFMRENSDPHWSTWPACIAIKAASMQGPEITEAFLRSMRRGAQAEGRNVSDAAVYEAIAQETPGLDLSLFKQALADGSAERAFLEDLLLGAQAGVRGFPTFVLRSLDPASPARPVRMGGARHFEPLRDAIRHLDPTLETHAPRSLPELLAEYGPMTLRELSEVLGLSGEALAETLENTPGLHRIPLRTGEFWALAAPADAAPADAAPAESQPASGLFSGIVAWDGEGMTCDPRTGLCR